MSHVVTRDRESVEYVKVRWSSDGDDLVDGTVRIAVVEAGIRPEVSDWQQAEWVGAPAVSRVARVLVGPLDPDLYGVWSGLAANPEEPVLPPFMVGFIKVV